MTSNKINSFKSSSNNNNDKVNDCKDEREIDSQDPYLQTIQAIVLNYNISFKSTKFAKNLNERPPIKSLRFKNYQKFFLNKNIF